MTYLDAALARAATSTYANELRRREVLAVYPNARIIQSSLGEIWVDDVGAYRGYDPDFWAFVDPRDDVKSK